MDFYKESNGESIEKEKERYMSDLVNRIAEQDMENIEIKESNGESIENSPQALAWNKCRKMVSELEAVVRAWKAFKLDKHQLAEMLLRDCCFILELFYKCNLQLNNDYADLLAGNFAMV